MFSTSSSVKHFLVTLQSSHRKTSEAPLAHPGPHHCHFPTALLLLGSAGLRPVLQVRNLLLTLSSLFYQDTSRDLRVGFRNATRGCQGCACVFKATLLGTPPALQLQIHALFQARGNFHYNLVPLVTRQAPFLLQPPAPSPSQRRLFLVVGPCFLPLESHQFLPASDFLVSGY